MLIDRVILWRLVNKRLRRKVHSHHVQGVLNILFEEMAEDLKQDKVIKIHNFGTISTYFTKPKKFFDYYRNMMRESRKIRRFLNFKMPKKLRDYIVSNIDFEKTFGGSS